MVYGFLLSSALLLAIETETETRYGGSFYVLGYLQYRTESVPCWTAIVELLTPVCTDMLLLFSVLTWCCFSVGFLLVFFPLYLLTAVICACCHSLPFLSFHILILRSFPPFFVFSVSIFVSYPIAPISLVVSTFSALFALCFSICVCVCFRIPFSSQGIETSVGAVMSLF